MSRDGFGAWIWWFDFHRWTFRLGSTQWACDAVAIPLWLPFLLGAIPAAYLWHRDRRIPPGHCQHCGYNLTANTSGLCPECGDRV
ncbi:MAG: hypothetical protein JXQ73_12120 [Phycisphaerae bacterium]|nr:hypothetical protein [Phycisphaerae bacterium]